MYICKIMFEVAKTYLNQMKNNKSYISHSLGSEFYQLNYDSHSWRTISREIFYYMLENKLIYRVSDFSDKEYYYRPTHLGFNHHIFFKNKETQKYSNE